jgi:Flp pilus assembly protein TadG
MIEFAFVVLILFVLLFGIIQWGLILSAHMTLRNATVVGARYATLINPQPTVSQIKDVTKKAAAPMLVSGSVSVTVSNVDVGSVTGATSVQASYPLKLILPYAIPGLKSGDTLTLSATTVMK